MNVRLILAYVALCSGLSAYNVRGLSGLAFYALGLVACLAVQPIQHTITARLAYVAALKQFEIEAEAARLLASQQFSYGRNY